MAELVRVNVDLTDGQRRALLRDGPSVYWLAGGARMTIEYSGWCTWEVYAPAELQRMADDAVREVPDLDKMGQ
jgi:hypothetical protein